MFTVFHHVLNKINEIMDLTMKCKVMLKLGSLTDESLIDDTSRYQLMLINGE
jgi:hypothetical protein